MCVCDRTNLDKWAKNLRTWITRQRNKESRELKLSTNSLKKWKQRAKQSTQLGNLLINKLYHYIINKILNKSHLKEKVINSL